MKLLNLGLLGLFSLTQAHPGHIEPEAELTAKRTVNSNAKRSLASCESKLADVNARAKVRRAATLQKHKRSLELRDTDSVLNTSHASNQSYNVATPDETVFGKSNVCALNLEGEAGPYWVKGEEIRFDLQEGQPGVPVILEAQFLDVETCEPLENVWWDLWNANATGVYSGLNSTGNGNADDLSNLDATFLRGIQKVDLDGVAAFKTIFPGHYDGRTNHHHMIAYLNATYEANGTITAGTYAYVGQLFWDQEIVELVEATYPYNTNNQSVTLNSEDRVFAAETANTTSDPVFEYTYLGDTLADGLFGWVSIVVNTSAAFDPNYSFVYTESGSIAESGGTESVN